MIPRISRITLAFTLVLFTVPSLVHAGRGGFRGGGYRGGMGGGYRGGMGMGRTGYGAGAGMGYGGYHDGWYHGAWNGNYGGWGGYGLGGYGGGLWHGLRIGRIWHGRLWPGRLRLGRTGGPTAGWATGRCCTTWVTQPTRTPSISTVRSPLPDLPSGASTQGARGTSYDYSQPIDTSATPPQQSATGTPEETIGRSRAVFKTGDYKQALDLCDQALQKLPNDPALHEFRAPCSSP